MMRRFCASILCLSFALPGWADDPSEADGHRLTIPVDPAQTESLTIPRHYAPLRSVAWLGSDAAVTVTPEPDVWKLSWKDRPADAEAIVMTFVRPPFLESDDVVAKQSGDGRVDLHAYAATTTGTKLRFEPQPHKNTVGFWVNADDVASWTIELERGGTFHVGILQGCGKDQGGSKMKLSIARDADPVAEVEFDVEETGHFQSFVWRTVGKLTVENPGRYTVSLQPTRIASKAAMDVRQIQLVRLPD